MFHLRYSFEYLEIIALDFISSNTNLCGTGNMEPILLLHFPKVFFIYETSKIGAALKSYYRYSSNLL